MKRSLWKSFLILVSALVVAGTLLWAESRVERPVESSRAGETLVLQESGEFNGWDDLEVALSEGEGGGHLAGPVRIVARVLALSDSQIEELLEDISEVSEINEDRRLNNQQIREELSSGDPDTELIGELVVANHDLGMLIADIRREFVESLTEEQKERLGAVRLAWRLKPVLPAFRAVGLLPHHRFHPGEGD